MKQHEETFDTRRYWEQRLLTHPGITGVGYIGLSPKFLEHQYRSRMYQVERALHAYGLTDLAGHSVLDVGSGTGIWLNFWHQHGAGHVVGLDFAQPSIDRLREQFPHDLIVQADLRVIPLPLPDTMRFDIISAFDVLLHIVDRDGLQHALANLACHCAPGGWLIISDPIVQGQGYVPITSYAIHNKVRSADEYRSVLAANGFTIESILPATVLLNAPLEAPNSLMFHALSIWWKATKLWASSNILSDLIGPGTIMIDQLACYLCPDNKAPSAKIIIAHKQK